MPVSESPLIEKAIYKSCSIKKKVVETDEKEISLRIDVFKSIILICA